MQAILSYFEQQKIYRPVENVIGGEFQYLFSKSV